jgi:cell division septation protein DedD
VSNLVRQRRAHDLWISKSHLYAYALSASLAVVAAFAGGIVVGRSSVEVDDRRPPAFTAEAGDQGLVELLARVDAAATPDGGVRDLTFPDALAGERTADAVPEPPAAEGAVHVEGAVESLPPRGDLPPSGRWTIAAASVPDRAQADRLAEQLRAKDLTAWVAPEQIDGEMHWRVGVGGWGSRSEAEEALDDLREAAHVGEHTPVVTRF